jgi:hypothetical protein
MIEYICNSCDEKITGDVYKIRIEHIGRLDEIIGNDHAQIPEKGGHLCWDCACMIGGKI